MPIKIPANLPAHRTLEKEGVPIIDDDVAIRQDIRLDIGGDLQQITQMHAQLSRVTFKHILLPVWLAAYKYREKSYRFVVNGQTGKVQGERPYSAWKIAFAVLIALILIAGGAYLYSVYGEGGSGQLLPTGDLSIETK